MKAFDQLEGRDPSKWQSQIKGGKTVLKVAGVLYLVAALLSLGFLFFVKKASETGALTSDDIHKATISVIVAITAYFIVGILLLIFSKKIDETTPNKNIFLVAFIILMVATLWFFGNGSSLYGFVNVALLIPIYTAYRAASKYNSINSQNNS